MINSKARYGFFRDMRDGYLIKCDNCKKILNANGTFTESVQGAICYQCKTKEG